MWFTVLCLKQTLHFERITCKLYLRFLVRYNLKGVLTGKFQPNSYTYSINFIMFAGSKHIYYFYDSVIIASLTRLHISECTSDIGKPRCLCGFKSTNNDIYFKIKTIDQVT